MWRPRDQFQVCQALEATLPLPPLYFAWIEVFELYGLAASQQGTCRTSFPNGIFGVERHVRKESSSLVSSPPYRRDHNAEPSQPYGLFATRSYTPSCYRPRTITPHHTKHWEWTWRYHWHRPLGRVQSCLHPATIRHSSRHSTDCRWSVPAFSSTASQLKGCSSIPYQYLSSQSSHTCSSLRVCSPNFYESAGWPGNFEFRFRDNGDNDRRPRSWLQLLRPQSLCEDQTKPLPGRCQTIILHGLLIWRTTKLHTNESDSSRFSLRSITTWTNTGHATASSLLIKNLLLYKGLTTRETSSFQPPSLGMRVVRRQTHNWLCYLGSGIWACLLQITRFGLFHDWLCTQMAHSSEIRVCVDMYAPGGCLCLFLTLVNSGSEETSSLERTSMWIKHSHVNHQPKKPLGRLINIYSIVILYRITLLPSTMPISHRLKFLFGIEFKCKTFTTNKLCWLTKDHLKTSLVKPSFHIWESSSEE